MEDNITNLKQPVIHVINQLIHALGHLSNEQYSQPLISLSNASIGQHVRHILELFICLETGYDSGVVSYENRKRDAKIESDKECSIGLLRNIPMGLQLYNKMLMLESGYDESSDRTVKIPTNYFREVAYNLEHTVHHMALIRVGFNELSLTCLPESFGVAASTIKHKRACAQ
ncbi:MAG TPA: hypothetical protein VF939_03320 [Puia sp.]